MIMSDCTWGLPQFREQEVIQWTVILQCMTAARRLFQSVLWAYPVKTTDIVAYLIRRNAAECE